MEEDINIVKGLIEDFKKDDRVIFTNVGLRKRIEFKAIENILNRLEQDEKVIEEMAKIICTNTPPFKKCKICIIDYVRKKCE